MHVTPKPVTIITGFLGAGKTTYLNHLLSQNRTVRYAIIENEFGEKGIDGELVMRPEESETIVELNNGCLCCTLNDNLYDILNELHDRRDEFDHILIEATGVADPIGLVKPFVAHPLIKINFPLQGVVCIVDAVLIEDHLENTEEAKNQISFSDVLLINKTDMVSPDYTGELADKLRALNPLASIMTGNREKFPRIELDPAKSPLDKVFASEYAGTNLAHESEFPVSRPHSHHHHKHTEEIVAQTFFFDQPFDIEQLHHQLMVYLIFQSAGLYRMKGMVWDEGMEDQYIVQSVGKWLDVEKRVTTATSVNRQSVMVFIGKNIERKGIEKLLKRCLCRQQVIES